ncbi:MAG: Ldh family oxidoreductase [Rhizobiales bacterium]|nr:Ldh family oxidoreductase [Hyphomicrobiales bacterium]
MPVLRFERLGPSLARLEGDSAMGFYPAAEAMRAAIIMARDTGIGSVGVRNSNFHGAGAYYVNLAAEAGLIGLALSNSFPKVAAHGGLLPVIGTNPFAFGAPRRNDEHLLFDMATSVMAGSSLRAAEAKGEASAEHLTGAGALLPFGGAKGFGIGLMVEILAGVLTGAGFGPGVSSMYGATGEPGENGHYMMAIDPARFMGLETFLDRMDQLAALTAASGGNAALPGANRHREAALSAVAGDSDSRGRLCAGCGFGASVRNELSRASCGGSLIHSFVQVIHCRYLLFPALRRLGL